MEDATVTVKVDYLEGEAEPWHLTIEGDAGEEEEFFERRPDAFKYARQLVADATDMGHTVQLLVYGRDGDLLIDEVQTPDSREMAFGEVDKCEPAPYKKLSMTKRSNLPAGKFAIPEDRAFPIPDDYHATLALSALLRKRNDKTTVRRVLAAVHKKFPGVYSCEKDLIRKIKSRYGI